MDTVTPGIIFKPQASANLFLGCDDLQYGQAAQEERYRRERLARLVRPGLVLDTQSDGTLGDGWRVTEDGVTAGALVLGASTSGWMLAVDDSGYAIVAQGPYSAYTETPPRARIVVANDGVWRTLVLRRGTTPYAEGTLAFDGSTVVVGTGTQFTRLTGRDEVSGTLSDHGTYLRIATADNATLGAGAGIGSVATNGLGTGCYEVSHVTDDTHLTLTAAPPSVTVSGVPFSIAGSFYNAGTAVTTPDVQRRSYPLLAVVTRTRTPAAGDIILADVQRASGVLTLLDRRDNSLAHTRESPPGDLNLIWEHTYNASTYASTLLVTNIWGADTTGPERVSIVPCSDPKLLLLKTTLTAIVCRTYDPTTNTTSGEVPIASPAACTGAYLLRVPAGNSAFKHYCFWTDGGICYSKSSTNNGTTWSGAASTVWDPSATSPLRTPQEPHAVLTRDHRVVIAFRDTVTAVGNFIDAIYSDDYGTTWATGTGAAGYTLNSSADSLAPWLAQDPVSGRSWLLCANTASGLPVKLFNNINTVLEGGSSTGYTALLGLTEYSQGYPCATVSRMGQLVVLTYERVTGSGAGATYMKICRVGFDGTALVHLENRTLFSLGSIIAYEAWTGMYHAPDGALWVLLTRFDGTNYSQDLLRASLS